MTTIPVVTGGEQDTPQRPAAPPVPARVPSVTPSVAAPPTRSAASTPDAVSTVRRAAYASDTSPSEARKFAHLAALKSLHPRAVEAVSKAGQSGDMDVLEADLSSLEAATTMRNWLARPGNAAVARDDIGTLALMENHLRRAERGWLGEMGAATGVGFDQLQGSYHHLRALFGVDVDAAYAGIAENARQVQRSQQGRSLSTQAYFQRLEHASGLGIIGAAFASPSKLPVLLAENFAFSVPARAAGFAGGLVSPVPGGSIAGMAAGGTLTEMGAYMQEAFTARGYDMADPASVRKAYSDPELVATLKAEAFRKGIGVAAVDALSVFFAGRQVAKAAGFGARARAFGVELVEQGVGEGAGEAVGQGFAHLDLSAIDWDDVVLESVAGLGQSAAEISLGAAYRRATAPLRAQTDATVRAAQDHEAIRAAVEAARSSKLAQELPEKAVEAADAILDGMDPEMRVARVPRETFDALAAAEGKSPSAWAEEIDPGGGAVAYGTSVLTGQVEIPTAALIVAASKIQGSDALLESARFRPDGMSVADVQAMTEAGAQAEQAARAASATFYQEEQPLRARAAEIDAALAATPEQAQGVAADLAAVLGPDTETGAGLVEEAAAAGGVQDADLVALLPEGTVLDAALAGQALAEAQTDPAGFAERLRGAARAAQVSDVAARTALETERAQIQVQLEAFDAERQTDQVVAQDLSTRVAAELEATGKFKGKTAAMMGRFYSRAYEVLAQRSGIPLRKFNERFPVTFGKGDGSRSAQTLEQRKRGATTITPTAEGASFDVEFLGKAKEHTFFHESGHVFLEILGTLARDPAASPKMREDFAELLKWTGIETFEDDAPIEVGLDKWAALPLEARRAAHEQFARGFEAYIRSGDAPSAGLRRIFSAFRAWMVRIYQDMRRLNVTLTPGVTRVMDRILATDAEIAAAEYESGAIDAIPQDVLDALPEDERVAYVAALEEARATAREQLQRKVETDLQRTKRQRAEAEAGVRADVTAYLMRDPAMIAVRHMMEGKTPDGADVPKGSRVQIAPEAIERLPQRRQDALRAMGIVAAPGEGYGLAQIAEMFGFPTESEAINGILAVRSGTEKVIDRLTKRRLQQDFPDLLSRAEVKAIARRDVANDALARLLKRENDALRKRMSEERQDAANERRAAFAPGLKITEIRFLAARILAPMRVSEIRPRAYLSAVGRERTAMAKALRAGNIQEAAAASDRARMNLDLFRIADGLVRRATRDTAYLRRTQRKTVRERLVRASATEPGETYAEQVNAIVESTGILPVPKSGPVPRTEALSDFVASQAARGIPIDIPPHLALDDRNRLDARRMTAAELHATRNAVEQIVQVATDADKMLTGDRKRKRSELARAAEVAVRESRPARPEVVGAPTRKERLVAFWQGWFDNGTRASIFARIMDSERDGGPVQTAIVRPINDATDATEILHRQNADRLSALYTEHYTAEELARMDEREDFGGVALSREDRLSILGHYGSITGRQRLSILLTADQLAAVLGSFTESDMAFAAARAAFFNELKALDDAVMARATGAKPPPLELAPFTVVTTSGKEITAPGWYMPVDYKRGTGKAFLVPKSDAHAVGASGGSPASRLPGGFRKGRVNVFDGKLDLSREVVLRHVRDVTTSIGMRDAVMDVQAILSDRELRRALVEHYGASVLGELDGWIRRVASDSNHPSSALEQGLATMRRRAVMSRLAFRLLVGVKQILGLRLTVMRVGARETWDASRQYLGSHAKMTAIGDWIAEKSAFMRERPTGTRYRELNEMLAAGSKVSTVEQMVTNSGFWFVIRGQLIADRVTWLAQYNKSMARAPQGLDEAGLALMDKQAVAEADQAVKDSQSGGQPVDQSYWEGGGPLVRLLTTYGTEMGLKFNMTRLVSARTDWRDPVSVAYALGSLGAIYAFEAGLAAITLGLTFDDDEEDESRLAAMSEKFAREVAGAALDTMPILREFSGAARGYGPPRPSPAFAVVGDTYYAAQQLAQVASPTEGTSRSDQLDSALARAINRVAGSSLGLPALALEEVVDAFGQIMDGNLPTALVGFKDR